MRSLTRCVRANILMTWLRVGSQKLPIRLEYQIFYKLTKMHVPILVGRSIISGCEGPTERISSFVETLPQPMVQLQQSYMKDATAFHHFHRKYKGRQRYYSSINERFQLVHKYTSRRRNEAYEKFNNHNAPIPMHYLRETLGLIFQENLFQFNEENGVICQYFHGGNWNEINPTKRNQAKRMETLHWWLPLGLRQRRSRWFIKRASYYHPSIKFTAEISENQFTFLGTTVFRGEKFAKPITRRPKPSNLRTSPRATHKA